MYKRKKGLMELYEETKQKPVYKFLEQAKNASSLNKLAFLKKAYILAQESNVSWEKLLSTFELGKYYCQINEAKTGQAYFLETWKQVEQVEMDEKLQDLLAKQGSLLSMSNDLNLLTDYLEQVKVQPIVQQDAFLQGICHYHQILYYYYKDNLPTCLNELNALIKSAKDSKQEKIEAKATFLLGIVYERLGIYDLAITQQHNAIKLLGKLENWEYQASAFNALGLIYHDYQKDYHKALEYYSQAQKHWEALYIERALGVVYNNIGDSHFKLKDFEKSQVYYHKALEVLKPLKEKRQLANVFANLGNLAIESQAFEEAENHLLKSLEYREAIEQDYGIVTSLNSLGRLYLLLNKVEVAQECLKRAYQIAREKELSDSLMDNLMLQKKWYVQQGEFEKAVQCMDEYLEFKEHLFDDKMANKFSLLTEVYETRQKEQRITLLEKQNEIERRAKKRIQTLMRELHHRVTNNLEILKSILSMQSHDIQDARLREAIKAGEARVNAMATIHRQLYGEGDITVVDVSEYLPNLIEYVMCAYNYDHTNFKLQCDIEVTDLEVDVAIPVGLIVNELAMNAMKYAYKNQPNPSLSLSLKFISDDTLDLVIADNGINPPFEIDLANADSFGLKLVSMLTDQLDGTASFNQLPENGLTCHLRFELE